MFFMFKIAAIGEKEKISIFSCAKIDTFYYFDEDKAKDKLLELSNDYSIIFITETLSEKLQDTIDAFKEKVDLSIVVIPSADSDEDAAIQSIRKSVIKAVGTDLSFDI